MERVSIPTGILRGLELDECSVPDLQRIAASRDVPSLERASFYGGELENVSFSGLTFRDCNFARVVFRRVNFRRCRFERVDLTRSKFEDCYISDCSFVACDPYYVTFEKTEVDPSDFQRCYEKDGDWNKALLLFSALREDLRTRGSGRKSNTAEYHLRVWERRHMYLRWYKKRRLEYLLPWMQSLLIGGLTGYGERPAYLAIWMFALISLAAVGYMKWFPSAAPGLSGGYLRYWYFSFRVFFAQGFRGSPPAVGQLAFQVAEFGSGLVLVAMFIGSVTRKLSS